MRSSSGGDITPWWLGYAALTMNTWASGVWGATPDAQSIG